MPVKGKKNLKTGEKKEIVRLNTLFFIIKIIQFEEKFSFELARKNK